MSAALLQPCDRTTQYVLLEGITWQTYKAILSDLGEHRASRLAYDRGTLEISMPLALHEFISRFLDRKKQLTGL